MRWPAVRCAGGADTGETCLSDAQIRAAEHGARCRSTIRSRSHKGWTTFSGWPTGSESAANWKTLQARPTAASNFGMLRSRIVRDAGREPPRHQPRELREGAAATLGAPRRRPIRDLSAFRRRGGKLIMKVNTTDYTVNPRWVMDYYDKVVQTMGAGAVDEFVRFYVAVGLFHNRNIGRNPLTERTGADATSISSRMLDDWVEQGKAPADTQVLSDMDLMPPFTVNATFPMCRYPMYPRYKGAGREGAENYACTRKESSDMKNESDITVILDKSGSMESIASDAIGGFNQFLTEQQRQSGECRLTLIEFDHRARGRVCRASDRGGATAHDGDIRAAWRNRPPRRDRLDDRHDQRAARSTSRGRTAGPRLDRDRHGRPRELEQRLSARARVRDDLDAAGCVRLAVSVHRSEPGRDRGSGEGRDRRAAEPQLRSDRGRCPRRLGGDVQGRVHVSLDG